MGLGFPIHSVGSGRGSWSLFLFWLHHSAYRILVPWPGIEPGPWQWKHWVLTTGNSWSWSLLSLWSYAFMSAGLSLWAWSLSWTAHSGGRTDNSGEGVFQLGDFSESLSSCLQFFHDFHWAMSTSVKLGWPQYQQSSHSTYHCARCVMYMSLYLHSGHRRGCHCLRSSAYRRWSWHLSLGGVCLPLSPLPHCPSSYLLRLMVGDWTEMNEKYLVNFTLLCTCELLGVITSFLFPTLVGTGTWVFHHFCIHKEYQGGTFYGFLVRNCWLIQVYSRRTNGGINQRYWPSRKDNNVLGN